MKRLRALVASVVSAGIMFSVSQPAFAVADFSKPTYIYGAGLSQDEIRRTAELLGIQSLNNITMDKVTGAELDYYIGNPGSYTSDADMISSVVVAKAKPGTGLDVNITTPMNITQIKKYQYENACITAGITDVYVNVGAISPVTGESALAGIYKALSINNVSLDKDRMEVAQKELEITNKIIQNNTQIIQNNTQINNNITNNNNNTTINNNNNINGNNNNVNNNNNVENNNNNNNVVIKNPINTVPGTTAPATTAPAETKPGETVPSTTAPAPVTIEITQQILNELLISIKTEVGEKTKETASTQPKTDGSGTAATTGTDTETQAEKTGLSREEIEAIIDEKLKAMNLDQSITNDVKIELVDVMQQYSQTEAAKSDEVQKQLEQLDQKVKEDPNSIKTNAENPIAVTIPPEQTVPMTEPETTTPEETIPVETVPENTVPENTIPVETVPGETVPETTTPEETAAQTTTPESTTEETTTPETTTPVEVTKDGFAKRTGTSEILPDKVKNVLANFPEGTNYVMLTLPEASTVVPSFDHNKAANIINNPYNAPYMAMNQDFVNNVTDGYAADYYAEKGTKYVYGEELSLAGNKIDYMHVRSDIKTASEDNGSPVPATLETFATAAFSTHLVALDGNEQETPGRMARKYIFALSEELNGDQNSVGVFNLGEQTMVLAFKDGKANAFFVDNNSGRKVDYNSMNNPFPQKSLTADGNIVDGLDDQPEATTTPETSAPEETQPEQTIPGDTVPMETVPADNAQTVPGE